MPPRDSNPTREQLAERWPARLAAIDWEGFETAYGPARNTPQQLMDLLATDRETAFTATHDLCCALCHQHAYISSAALPALPFLLEALRLGDERLNVELLDILAGLAKLSKPPTYTGPGERHGAWALELRKQLLAERSCFEALRASADEEVADFADWVLSEL